MHISYLIGLCVFVASSMVPIVALKTKNSRTLLSFQNTLIHSERRMRETDFEACDDTSYMDDVRGDFDDDDDDDNNKSQEEEEVEL
jgi:hypothetical protein